MNHTRDIVVDLDFEAAVGQLTRAIRDRGLTVISRLDVRDHFLKSLRQTFRRYVLVEAWSPELAIEALQRDPGAGALLPTAFAVYELEAGKTAVVAAGRVERAAADATHPQQAETLAAIAEKEARLIDAVFDALRRPVQDCGVAHDAA